MVGSLSVLRDECRRAKERLSAETATAIAIECRDGDHVRMTRMELEHLIDEPLAEFLAALATPWTAIGFRWRASRRSRRSAAVPASRWSRSGSPSTCAHRRHHPASAAHGRRRRRADRPPQPGRRDRDGDGARRRTAAPPRSPRPQSAAHRRRRALAWSEVDDERMTSCTPSRTSRSTEYSATGRQRPEVHFQHEEFGEQPRPRRSPPCCSHWRGRPWRSPRWSSASRAQRETTTPVTRRTSSRPPPRLRRRRLPPSSGPAPRPGRDDGRGTVRSSGRPRRDRRPRWSCSRHRSTRRPTDADRPPRRRTDRRLTEPTTTPPDRRPTPAHRHRPAPTAAAIDPGTRRRRDRNRRHGAGDRWDGHRHPDDGGTREGAGKARTDRPILEPILTPQP